MSLVNGINFKMVYITPEIAASTAYILCFPIVMYLTYMNTQAHNNIYYYTVTLLLKCGQCFIHVIKWNDVVWTHPAFPVYQEKLHNE